MWTSPSVSTTWRPSYLWNVEIPFESSRLRSLTQSQNELELLAIRLHMHTTIDYWSAVGPPRCLFDSIPGVPRTLCCVLSFLIDVWHDHSLQRCQKFHSFSTRHKILGKVCLNDEWIVTGSCWIAILKGLDHQLVEIHSGSRAVDAELLGVRALVGQRPTFPCPFFKWAKLRRLRLCGPGKIKCLISHADKTKSAHTNRERDYWEMSWRDFEQGHVQRRFENY